MAEHFKEITSEPMFRRGTYVGATLSARGLIEPLRGVISHNLSGTAESYFDFNFPSHYNETGRFFILRRLSLKINFQTSCFVAFAP